MQRRRRRKCRHCKQLYQPDPRNRWHQKYCSHADCQAVSKRASQRRWTRSDLGRHYAKRPQHGQRVKAWRAAHPGYAQLDRKKSATLQDLLISQPHPGSRDTPVLNEPPLTIPPAPPDELSSTAGDFDPLNPLTIQDVLFLQSPLWTGFVALLTGGTLPEDIASFTRRVILLGSQIQGQTGLPRRVAHAHPETRDLPRPAAQSAAAVQLDRSPSGSG